MGKGLFSVANANLYLKKLDYFGMIDLLHQ